MKTEYTPVDPFEFISLAEAKRQLKLDSSFDDEDTAAEVAGFIATAKQAAEDYMERDIIAETLVITLDVFKRMVCFEDWRPMVKDNVSVSVVPFGATDPVTVPAVDYTFSKWDSQWQVYFSPDLVLAEVPNAMVITVNCLIPATVKQACLLKLSDFDTFREDRPAFDNGNFEKLLRRYRKY